MGETAMCSCECPACPDARVVDHECVRRAQTVNEVRYLAEEAERYAVALRRIVDRSRHSTSLEMAMVDRIARAALKGDQ
jgi:hypothetical protein